MRKLLTICAIAMAALVGCGESPASKSAEATGFVRLEKINNTWWFIDPAGEKFLSIGVNHIEPHLWAAPYNIDFTRKKYGADFLDADGHFDTNSVAAQRWIDAQVAICRDLNFNTFGKHTHPNIDTKLYSDQIYYMAPIEAAPLSGWRKRKGEGPMPDVFSEDFKIYLDKRIKAITDRYKDDRNMIGYTYTDIPAWKMPLPEQRERGDKVMIYLWINRILELGVESPGKQAWIDHLMSRYSSPEEVAATWGMAVSECYGKSWEDLARSFAWFKPVDAKRATADMESFMYVVADKWYGLHYEIIKKYDPNHLILGDKNMSHTFYEWLYPALSKYVDAVAVQTYGLWSKDKVIYDKIYKKTGKPIYNGDGSYGFSAPEQMGLGTKGTVATHAKSFAEVAEYYKETMEGMMSTPYIVGWHHCGYLQQWDDAERGDSERNENGFMNAYEEYITEWTDVIKDVNSRVHKLHEASEKR